MSSAPTSPATPKTGPVKPAGASQHAIARSGPVDIVMRRRRVIGLVLASCLAIEIALVALDYFVNYSRGTELSTLRRMFNITREDSLASFFYVTQMIMVALTAWALWLVVRSTAPRPRLWRRLGWLGVAVFFSYLSVDDGATIHERVGSAYKAVQNDQRDREIAVAKAAGLPPPPKLEFRSYTWQLVFVPVFGVAGMGMMAFLWFELASMRQRVLIAASLCAMALAVGIDYIEGMNEDDPWNVYARIADRYDFEAFAKREFDSTELRTLVHFSKSFEETIEAVSITMVWVVLLSHLMQQGGGEVRLRFANPPRT